MRSAGMPPTPTLTSSFPPPSAVPALLLQPLGAPAALRAPFPLLVPLRARLADLAASAISCRALSQAEAVADLTAGGFPDTELCRAPKQGAHHKSAA